MPIVQNISINREREPGAKDIIKILNSIADSMQKIELSLIKIEKLGDKK